LHDRIVGVLCSRERREAELLLYCLYDLCERVLRQFAHNMPWFVLIIFVLHTPCLLSDRTSGVELLLGR
jgi:hypothetical protein